MSKSESGIDRDAGALLDERRQGALGGEFHGAPLLLEGRVVRQRLQLAELIEVAQPAVADALGDELGERRIADGHEPARGDAVGDIEELLRPQLGEVVHDGLDQEVRMELRHAVDMMTAHRGKIGHAHVTFAAFVNQRHPGQAGVIAREFRPHFVEEAPVDFVNDFEVPRQQVAEQADRPFLQRLGQRACGWCRRRCFA